jgi:diacylglycerol kinase
MNLPTPLIDESMAAPSKARGKPRRKWSAKFGDAFRGIKLGVRGHSSFSVHFFFAALVFTAAVVFRCDLFQWCILIGCIGFVIVAELFNSAVEALYHGLADEESKRRCKPCLDIAAGAVLVASIFAAVVGSLIFLDLFGKLLRS